jgi:uncharacterized protein YbcV (DUF1398 family)
MDTKTKTTIEECAHRSHRGDIDFGTVVMKLTTAGVETYHADYRRGETTYYLPDGATHVVAFPESQPEVAQRFAASEVESAVRDAQAGALLYPGFVTRTLAAGCVGYFVWIAGRKVQYFGRRGEVHTEYFPDS